MRFQRTSFITAISAMFIAQTSAQNIEKPNILMILADDWSWPHAGIYGCNWVHTSNMDKLAAEGVVFHNAFASTPSCAPSLFAILTGRHFFQNMEGAVHRGLYPFFYGKWLICGVYDLSIFNNFNYNTKK
jgi:N-sulfoglucosamine sulfohydrolase